MSLSADNASRRQAQTGFTIVELVLVMIVLGVLAAVAMPRFFNDGAFDDVQLRDELTSALRYAQQFAVATQCPATVQIDGATDTYSLSYADDDSAVSGPCDGGGAINRPGTAAAYAGPSDAVGGDILGSHTVVFDRLGRPGGAASIGLSNGDTVIVAAETGYVYRQ